MTDTTTPAIAASSAYEIIHAHLKKQGASLESLTAQLNTAHL